MGKKTPRFFLENMLPSLKKSKQGGRHLTPLAPDRAFARVIRGRNCQLLFGFKDGLGQIRLAAEATVKQKSHKFMNSCEEYSASL
jgi:hypothetical protein